MTDTPRTNEALAALLDRDGELSEENAPEVLVKLCRAMERKRDESLKWSAMLADAGDEIRAQLREEQRLHVQTLNERDEARQWESQALVARIQRDEFSKTLGEVREILCEALPNENQLTSSMAATLVKERDEAREIASWWRDNWKKGRTMSMIASTELPWENDQGLATQPAPQMPEKHK